MLLGSISPNSLSLPSDSCPNVIRVLLWATLCKIEILHPSQHSSSFIFCSIFLNIMTTVNSTLHFTELRELHRCPLTLKQLETRDLTCCVHCCILGTKNRALLVLGTQWLSVQWIVYGNNFTHSSTCSVTLLFLFLQVNEFNHFTSLILLPTPKVNCTAPK